MIEEYECCEACKYDDGSMVPGTRQEFYIGDDWIIETYREDRRNHLVCLLHGPGHLTLELVDTTTGKFEDRIREALAIAQCIARHYHTEEK